MKKNFILLILIMISSFAIFSESLDPDIPPVTEVYEKSFTEFERTFFQAKRILMGNTEYLNSIIDDISLAQLNLKELRLLRNIIYAQYGKIFNSQDLTDYYSKFSWYVPKRKNVDPILSEIDKQNLKNIIAFENAYAKQKSIFIDPNNLRDPWAITSAMPADWPITFVFENNNTVKYFTSKETPMRIFDGFGAKYFIDSEKGFITLNVNEIYFNNHSETYDTYLGSYWWDSSQGRITVCLSNPIILNFPISEISEISFRNGTLTRNQIQIGNYNYYQYKNCIYEE